jgi:hypothetical protein
MLINKNIEIVYIISHNKTKYRCLCLDNVYTLQNRDCTSIGPKNIRDEMRRYEQRTIPSIRRHGIDVSPLPNTVHQMSRPTIRRRQLWALAVDVVGRRLPQQMAVGPAPLATSHRVRLHGTREGPHSCSSLWCSFVAYPFPIECSECSRPQLWQPNKESRPWVLAVGPYFMGLCCTL